MWVEREEGREIRMPEEWGGTISSQVFLDEARRIVEEGEKEGLSYSRKPVLARLLWYVAGQGNRSGESSLGSKPYAR